MLMEFLNWMIIVILFFVTDAFLNYKFSWYGTRVWRYYRLPIEVQRETANPMCDAFPRIGERTQIHHTSAVFSANTM